MPGATPRESERGAAPSCHRPELECPRARVADERDGLLDVEGIRSDPDEQPLCHRPIVGSGARRGVYGVIESRMVLRRMILIVAAAVLAAGCAAQTADKAEPRRTEPISTPVVAARPEAPETAPAVGIPTSLPELPKQGVAVERRSGVDLVDFSGRVLAHLDGFSIFYSTARPGPLVLQRGNAYFALSVRQHSLRQVDSRKDARGTIPSDPTEVALPSPWIGPDVDYLLGRWRYAMRAPDSATVLAQWSGECEVPIAFFYTPSWDGPIAVTGERRLEDAPESFALGWTADSRAVVLLPTAACGSAFERPGVYLFTGPGKGTYLVPVHRFRGARMWGAA